MQKKEKRPSSQQTDESSPPKKPKKSNEKAKSFSKPDKQKVVQKKPDHKKTSKNAGNPKKIFKDGDPKKNLKNAGDPKKILKNAGDPKKKFSKNPQNTEDGKKTDWNEYKKKVKVDRMKRKEKRNLYDVVVEAKKIGEKLRVKKLPGGNKERDELVNKLHELLKEKYVNIVLTHDMARIVQYMLKFGSVKVREEIASEIIPSTVQMLQSKYGRSCVKFMLKYGNAETRDACVRKTYSNAVKLVSHGISAPVFEYAYTTWASPQHKICLVQEFFGDVYKQTKDESVRHLRDVYRDSETLKAAALSSTKANLSRCVDKNLLDSGLLQTVLWQFLSECSVEDRTELVTQLSPHVVVISNSRDGAKAAMECVWYGTNKDKKVLLKALKEHIVDVCKHEHAHSVVISVLDSFDDTVLLNKIILKEILGNANDLLNNEWGRKVLLWLVAPGDNLHFHPKLLEELDAGRQKSTSKKDVATRRKELLGYSSEILLKAIAEEPKSWLESSNIVLATLTVLKTGSGEDLEKALKAVCKAITDLNWKLPHEKSELLCVEHPALHMCLKKLAQHDKELEAAGSEFTFGSVLLDALNEDIIETWIKSNRGCFLLVIVYENNSDRVQEQLQKLLKPYKKVLKKETTKGASILCKKLKGAE